MIGMLNGTVLVIGTGEAVLDINGVGYLLQCGSRTLAGLHQGEAALLHVETHVRETAITLYGFLDEEERAWFVKLQSVQKVGPKAALAILDVLSPDEILSAANLEDKTAFSRANGVGPSLAGRIVVELSGKAAPTGRGFGAQINLSSSAKPSKTDGESQAATGRSHLNKDAVSALANLGIGESDAVRAVALAYQQLSENDEVQVDLNGLVKTALKALSA